MTISDIVRETLKTLNSNKMPLTPDNYAKMFCKIATKRGFDLIDCNRNKRFMSKLNPFLKEDTSKYNINTTEELLTYLIATLNRITGQEKNRQNLILVTLVKRLLQSMTVLHNKKASELANASLERIEYLADYNTFEIIKDKWFEFLTNYDESLFDKLKPYCHVDKSDLELTINEVVTALEHAKEDKTIESMASMIVSSLTPSLTDIMDDELATLSYELKNAPHIINTQDVQKRISNLVEKRIEIDREEVKNRILSLDELLGDVSDKIVNLVNNSSLSRDRISKIKRELQSFDHGKHNFETVKARLTKIADSLEVETDLLSKKMQKDDAVVRALQVKIKKLEGALSVAKKESKKDFLTALVSKRGLDEELNRVEKSFIRYKIEYSICFFDIDYFKKVNDTFGHEAGDVILKKLGAIFIDLKRDVDIIGRYGGEEFLAVLPNTPLSGALVFSEKVRKKVESFDFLYKNEAVPVTISVGVAHCNDYKDQKEMIAGADKALYAAKQTGRNRVMPEVL
ncbi:MAG TPA: GGDEF domain-containing protein [Campylobacterales bacterium]|nr:GGDEF domain-containing protein [Campylobacterales bacterium]